MDILIVDAKKWNIYKISHYFPFKKSVKQFIVFILLDAWQIQVEYFWAVLPHLGTWNSLPDSIFPF